MNFDALGKTGAKASREALETFPRPAHVDTIQFSSGELTASCPVTNQPDIYFVQIKYEPSEKCIETKSLKLYLWSFRDETMFAEALASRICEDIAKATDPWSVQVELTQNIRGGIATTVVAIYEEQDL